MKDSNKETTIKIVRSLITSSHPVDGIFLRNLMADFENMIGTKLPCYEYKTPIDFLRSSNAFEVRSAGSDFLVYAKTADESRHISKLVSEQNGSRARKFPPQRSFQSSPSVQNRLLTVNRTFNNIHITVCNGRIGEKSNSKQQPAHQLNGASTIEFSFDQLKKAIESTRTTDSKQFKPEAVQPTKMIDSGQSKSQENPKNKQICKTEPTFPLVENAIGNVGGRRDVRDISKLRPLHQLNGAPTIEFSFDQLKKSAAPIQTKSEQQQFKPQENIVEKPKRMTGPMIVENAIGNIAGRRNVRNISKPRPLHQFTGAPKTDSSSEQKNQLPKESECHEPPKPESKLMRTLKHQMVKQEVDKDAVDAIVKIPLKEAASLSGENYREKNIREVGANALTVKSSELEFSKLDESSKSNFQDVLPVSKAVKRESDTCNVLKPLYTSDNIPKIGTFEPPSVSSCFEVEILKSEGPSSFVIRPVKYKTQWQELMKSLQIYCKETPDTVPPEAILDGQIYACLKSNGYWHRAIIKLHRGKVFAFFCDVDDIETIADAKKIKGLPKEFRSIPKLATNAKLFGIKPINNAWEMDDNIQFHRITKGCTLIATVANILFDKIDGKNFTLEVKLNYKLECINDLFVKSGRAVYG